MSLLKPENTFQIQFDIAGGEFTAWVEVNNCTDDLNYNLQSFFVIDENKCEVNLWPLLGVELSEEQQKQGDFKTVNCVVDYEIRDQLEKLKECK